MKKFQVLLSALKLESANYIDGLNIKSDCVIINQCDEEKEEILSRKSDASEDFTVTYVQTKDRGLSKSRNMAISKASADICILCDNDVVYVDDYKDIILRAYKDLPDADFIVFYIERKEKPKPLFDKVKRMDYFSVLKIFSPEISFKRESLVGNGLKFKEEFGAGSGKYIMGEENIFLYDALKKGMKIYYVPQKIAKLKEVESTWFSDYDERFFISRGAGYTAMSKFFSHILIWQFALRKTSLYKKNMSLFKAVQIMYKGRREYLNRG